MGVDPNMRVKFKTGGDPLVGINPHMWVDPHVGKDSHVGVDPHVEVDPHMGVNPHVGYSHVLYAPWQNVDFRLGGVVIWDNAMCRLIK